MALPGFLRASPAVPPNSSRQAFFDLDAWDSALGGKRSCAFDAEAYFREDEEIVAAEKAREDRHVDGSTS